MAQITGNSGDDVLDGTIFRDTIDGLGGDDWIDGRDADDTLRGGTGDDEIYGGDGEDLIEGGDSGEDESSVDKLYGESGNDIIYGDEGWDNLYGGTGNDELYGGYGNDLVEFNWEDLVVNGGGDDDLLIGNPTGPVTGFWLPLVEGGGGSDWLTVYSIYDSGTWSSDHTLTANLATSSAIFSYDFNGNPAAFATMTQSIENLQGGMNGDYLTGDDNANSLIGGGGDDFIAGGGGNDLLLGGSDTADTLYGRDPAGSGSGPDGNYNEVYGGDGNDAIHAFGTHDEVFGDDNNDTIYVDDGADAMIDGGDDFDTLYYYGYGASVDGLLLGAGGSVTGIEEIRFHGGTYSDVGDLDIDLDASMGTSLDGGELTVIGAEGDDRIDGSRVDEGVTLILEGGDGDDTFEGATAEDLTDGDVFDGGAGIDTLDLGDYVYNWGGAPVLVGANGTVTSVEVINLHGPTVGAGLNDVEIAIPLANSAEDGLLTVNGAQGQDFIHGDRVNNASVRLHLNGGGGNDFLYGGVGLDELDGGTGGDFMEGGVGNDHYIVDSVDDTVIEDLLGGSDDIVSASIDYTLGDYFEHLILSGSADLNGTGNSDVNIMFGNDGENSLSGEGGGDTLYGDDGNDELDGGTGADTMEGGEGDDTYVVDDAGDVVTELNNEGASDMILSSIGKVLPAYVENLWLTGTANINAVGNLQGNLLVGNAGNNALTAVTGADYLYGFGGIDVLWGGAGGDMVDGGEGIDTAIYTGSLAGVTVDLTAGTGSGGDAQGDTLVKIEHVLGSGFADTLIGDASANILNGGDGADTMQGLLNDDTYIVDNAADVVLEAANEGADTINASVSYVLAAGKSVETMRTINAAATTAMNLTGNELGNTIIGNAGINLLVGGGNVDTLQGLADNDAYFVDNALDVVIEAAGQGTDNVNASVSYTLAAGVQVETLRTTNAAGVTAINLVGNELNNFVTGNDGTNFLVGGGGVDTLTGNGSNDSYLVDNAADVVVELADDGIDNVNASVDYTLDAGVSSETLRTDNAAGVAAIDLTGNEINNFVTGNAGANILNGGLGSDTLTGNGGTDTFVFNTVLNAATNVDTIVDFVVVDDTIQLENAIFTGLAAGTLAATALRVGAAAADADDRIIYNNTTGLLSFDSDGTGANAATQFATLATGLALTNNDFVVI